MKIIVLNIVLALAVANSPCLAAEVQWPEMREFEADFVVNTSAEKIEFIRPLYDVNGTVRYLFVCRGGSTEYLDKLSDQTNRNYVGPFGCRLSEGDKEVEDSLLSEDDSAPWYSRGQFHSYDEVIKDCGDYPEYGRVRHFRLRGFELSLSAIDPVYNNHNQLESFNMKVSLRRNDKITSAQAEQPGYLTPYKQGMSCKKIAKGNEPKMCRNWKKGGSYEPCQE